MKKVLCFLIAFVLATHAFAQEKDVIMPTSNLIVEGIPAIPASIAETVKRYSESRGAGFGAWHPVKREMIIGTRFGNVNQLHEVKFPMGARKQITFYDDAVGGSSFEPSQGKYLLFSKDKGGDEFWQWYRYDFSTGETTMITDGGRSQNGGPLWSNKGKVMAFTSTKRNGADRDIYMMDPANPSTVKIIAELKGGGWGASDWSPDDKKIVVVESISANESHLWMLDVATKEMKRLTPENEKNVSYGNPTFSKDGKGIYLVTDKDNEFYRLAFMDFSGKITYLVNDIPWDITGFNISKDGKKIAFLTNEAGSSRVFIFNTATKKYSPITSLPIGQYGAIAFHDNNKDLAVNVNSARSSADVYVVDLTNGKSERWTESEMGGLVPDKLSIPTLIKWKSFDGKEISGFYYKAASKFEGKRPVMINIHGGPEGQTRPGYIGAMNYYLNEMGVSIIFPNVRGSTGYGKSFLASDNGFKREESVKDIGALLDWIEKQPDLDASRVMVTGGSYGGYMTLAVATNYNDRIKCALDIVGISHFGTFLKNTESYRRDLRRVEYGDERDPAMAEFFEKISPLNNASKITKPMFIVQGATDPRVPRTEAVQMAEKIRKNGGEVWYLEAKDEGHGFRKKTNNDFLRFATILFMQKYLL